MIQLLLVVFTIILSGCNYTIQKSPGANSGNQAISRLPPGTIPGYQLIASAIIAPKCLECHSSGGGNAGGVNLETYEALKNNLPSLRDEITSGRMPKNRGPLSASEKEVFLAWLDAGAPEVGSSPNNPPVPDPEFIDYQLVKTSVIDLRCIGCHSAKGGDKGGVNLETYENVFDQKDSIKSEIESGSMPRPKNKPLTDIQKRIFLSWIENGAPEKGDSL